VTAREKTTDSFKTSGVPKKRKNRCREKEKIHAGELNLQKISGEGDRQRGNLKNAITKGKGIA